MRPISLTALRSNLFKIVAEVIETGNPDELSSTGSGKSILRCWMGPMK